MIYKLRKICVDGDRYTVSSLAVFYSKEQSSLQLNL